MRSVMDSRDTCFVLFTDYIRLPIDRFRNFTRRDFQFVMRSAMDSRDTCFVLFTDYIRLPIDRVRNFTRRDFQFVMRSAMMDSRDIRLFYLPTIYVFQ